uniref:Uncharacterized protein n=1 Tax=Oryza sativa subsp. japonica TaxID=39947 RepID=Q7XHX1_ORYSJ|nr:hypothetical protein [Oryza sativa Japonica Group]BAD31223.1 hypothetical protein [Oryza sativa Japonica Group]
MGWRRSLTASAIASGWLWTPPPLGEEEEGREGQVVWCDRVADASRECHRVVISSARPPLPAAAVAYWLARSLWTSGCHRGYWRACRARVFWMPHDACGGVAGAVAVTRPHGTRRGWGRDRARRGLVGVVDGDEREKRRRPDLAHRQPDLEREAAAWTPSATAPRSCSRSRARAPSSLPPLAVGQIAPRAARPSTSSPACAETGGGRRQPKGAEGAATREREGGSPPYRLAAAGDEREASSERETERRATAVAGERGRWMQGWGWRGGRRRRWLGRARRKAAAASGRGREEGGGGGKLGGGGDEWATRIAIRRS